MSVNASELGLWPIPAGPSEGDARIPWRCASGLGTPAGGLSRRMSSDPGACRRLRGRVVQGRAAPPATGTVAGVVCLRLEETRVAPPRFLPLGASKGARVPRRSVAGRGASAGGTKGPQCCVVGRGAAAAGAGGALSAGRRSTAGASGRAPFESVPASATNREPCGAGDPGDPAGPPSWSLTSGALYGSGPPWVATAPRAPRSSDGEDPRASPYGESCLILAAAFWEATRVDLRPDLGAPPASLCGGGALVWGLLAMLLLGMLAARRRAA